MFQLSTVSAFSCRREQKKIFSQASDRKFGFVVVSLPLNS